MRGRVFHSAKCLVKIILRLQRADPTDELTVSACTVSAMTLLVYSLLVLHGGTQPKADMRLLHPYQEWQTGSLKKLLTVSEVTHIQQEANRVLNEILDRVCRIPQTRLSKREASDILIIPDRRQPSSAARRDTSPTATRRP